MIFGFLIVLFLVFSTLLILWELVGEDWDEDEDEFRDRFTPKDW